MKQFTHRIDKLLPAAFCAVFIFCGVIFGGGSASASTNISGDISSNTTWTTAGSPYIIVNTTSISSGVTLTIEAGVTVKFDTGEYDYLGVSGTLDVNGTSGDRVIFTSVADSARGQWTGIRFASGSYGYFDNAVIRYGGKSCAYCYPNQKMIWNQGGALMFTDSDIVSSSYYSLYQESGSLSFSGGLLDYGSSGVYVTGGTASFDGSDIGDTVAASTGATSLSIVDSDVTSCTVETYAPFTFTGNELSDATVTLKRLTSTFTHSGNTVVSGYAGYRLDGYMGADATLEPEAGMAYLVNSFSVDSGRTLTVAAGTILKFLSTTSYHLDVGGTLDVNGTSESPVYLTSYKDDSVGGDTNGDGASSGAASDWNGIHFASGSYGYFDNAVIRYGGKSCAYCYPNQKMIWNQGGALSFDDSNIVNSSYYGVYQDSGSVTMAGGLVDGTNSGIYYVGGTMSFDDVEIKDKIDARNTATSLSVTDSYLNYGAIDSYVAFTFTGNTLSNSTVTIKRLTTFTHSGNTVTSGIAGYYLYGSTGSSVTLSPESGIVYIVDNFSVTSGHTLTVDSGTIIKFLANSDDYFSVSGSATLDVNGTSENKVYFTSYKDDSVGGDTNNNGSSTGAVGDWNGIRFASGSIGDFAYAVIRYGGNDCTYCTPKEIMVENSGGTIVFSDSQIAYSKKYGLKQTSGTTEFDATEINNQTYGAYISGGTVTADTSNIHNCTTGFYTTGASTLLDVADSDLSVNSTGVSSNSPLTLTGNDFSGNGVSVLLGAIYTFTHSGNTISGAVGGYKVAGYLAADYALSPDDLPFVVDYMTVYGGRTLTVDPGTVIKFLSTTSYLQVSGTLDVNGTAQDKVYFTSYKDDSAGGDTNDNGASTGQVGDWAGIQFESGSVGDVTHAIIRYGGADCTYCYPKEIEVNNLGGALAFTNSQITYSKKYGLKQTSGSATLNATEVSHQNYGIYATDGTVTVDEGDIHANSTYGIYAYGSSVTLSVSDSDVDSSSTGLYIYNAPLTLTGNSFTGSGTPVNIYVPRSFAHSGNTMSAGMNGFQTGGAPQVDVTLTTSDLPYVLTGMTIPSGRTLTVDPGAIVKLKDQSAYLTVNDGGTLDVNGTSDDLVYFTSFKDDVGGDTNANGSANSPAAGDWLKLQFDSGSTADIDYAIIRYGGYNATTGYRYMLYNDGGDVSIADSIIASSYRFGYYQNDGDTSIDRTIVKDQTYGVYAVDGTIDISSGWFKTNTRGIQIISGTTSVDHSVIDGNSEFGLTTSVAVNAENNFWGDASGPYHVTLNPYGEGDNVSDNVDFDPWLEFAPYTTGHSSVDDGEIRWDGSTMYSDNWENATELWNDEGLISVTPDIPEIGEDITIADIDNEELEWYGVYSYATGIILFNRWYMTPASESIQNRVTAHELGHALGLAHSTIGNMMNSDITQGNDNLAPLDKFTYKYLWE